MSTEPMHRFFNFVRETFGKLSQGQVDGFNAVLAATQHMRLEHRAYILATAWHETAATMQPVYERGPEYYFRKYDPRHPIGDRLGNTEPGDGYRFRGRGYVQLTGRRNYAFAGQRLAIPLAAQPDLALEPETAAKIAVTGMEQGWFTGRKLADYIDAGKCDYRNARRIINGIDKAEFIAWYAKKFETALRSAISPAEA